MLINPIFFNAVLVSVMFLSTALVGVIWFFTGFKNARQLAGKKPPVKKIIRLDEEKLEEFMSRSLVKATNQYLKEAEKAFQSVVSAYLTEADKQIIDFSAHLGRLTNGWEEEVRQKVAEEKEKRLKELDQDITLIIQKVAEEVLGKTLSTEEQEELVLEALEKAKKQI